MSVPLRTALPKDAACRWLRFDLNHHTSSHDARYSLCEVVACRTPSARSRYTACITTPAALGNYCFSASPVACDSECRHRHHLSHLRFRQLSSSSGLRVAPRICIRLNSLSMLSTPNVVNGKKDHTMNNPHSGLVCHQYTDSRQTPWSILLDDTS